MGHTIWEFADSADEAEAAPAERQPRKKRIAVDVLTEAFIKAGLPDGATEAVIKGGAKGIAGVAVRPVVGVLDGASAVLDGVSSAAATSTPTAATLAPPLFLAPLPDSDERVLQGATGLA